MKETFWQLFQHKAKEIYLGVFSVSSIHDSCAANLCNSFAMTVETPAANFIGANDIFDEQDSIAES